MGPVSQVRSRRRWLWLVGGIALAGGLLLLGVILARHQLFRAGLASVLNQRLTGGGSLAQARITPWAGTAELSDLTLLQPQEFSGAPLLTVAAVAVAVQPGSLLGPVVRVPRIRVSGLTLHLIRRADGQVNLAHALVPRPTPSLPPTPPQGTVDITRIEVEDALVMFEDHRNGGQWTARLEHLTTTVDDLHLDLADPGALAWRLIQIQVGTLMIPGPNGTSPALAWSGVTASVDPIANQRDPLAFAVEIQGLTIQGDRDQRGLNSLNATVERLASLLPAGGSAQVSTSPPKPIHLRSLHLDGFQGVWADGQVADPPWQINVDQGDLTLTDLWINPPPGLTTPPARLGASARLLQPDGLPPSHLGIRADAAPFTSGLPVANARCHATGLDLSTLGPVLPRGSRTLLGGRALDLGAAIAHGPAGLELRAELRNERGVTFPIRVAGPVHDLDLSLTPLLGALLHRTGDSLLSAGSTVVKTGIDTVKGGAKTVVDAGKNLGGGLLTTLGGLVTLDRDAISDGLGRATKGTAGSLVEGVAQVRAEKPDQKLVDWFADADRRHRALLAESAQLPTPGRLPTGNLTLPAP